MTVHTIAEAAGIMRCSENSVYRLVETGRLRAFRVGRRGWRITEDALNAYMGGDGAAS